MTKVVEQLRESIQALREVYANRGLRRLQLAWAGSIIGTWAFSVALSVYAYRHGGASAVGLVVLIRWLPAAFTSPFTGILGDRYPRVLVMMTTDVLRAAAFVGMTFCVLAHAPAGAVYALVGVTSVISTAFRPAQAALLPALARTPEELTAANVSSSTLESLGFCAGPALGGILLAVSSTWLVFAVTAGTFVWSALLLAGLLRTDEPPLRTEPRPLVHEAVEGMRAIAQDKRLQLVIGLFSAQTLVNGAMGVLITVSALQLLHIGAAGVGYLNAAVGVGGLVSAVLSGPVARVARQGRGMLAGTMIWGAAIACFGLTASLPLALLMLAVAGAADTLTVTLRAAMVQTVTPDELRGRVSSVEYIIGTGGAPLGNVESGAVASLTTPVISTVAGGLGCLAIAALIGLMFPAFARYRNQPASRGG